MKTIEVETNIMCGSCVAKVKPTLDETFGENNWKVDLQNPKKVLTVSMHDENVNQVIKTVEIAGYKAAKIAS